MSRLDGAHLLGGGGLAAQRRELRADLALQKQGALQVAPHLAQLELRALAAALVGAKTGGLLDLARRSSGLPARNDSTLPWPMMECSSLPRPTCASSSMTSVRRQVDWLMEYCDEPSRVTRRITLTSGVGSGRDPSLLSKVSSTSAAPLARRPSLPAKMTSCMDEPRTVVGLCSPSAQITASARLLLPLPLGPMITPTPGSKRSSVCLGNDLKPLRRSALRYT